MTLTQYNGLKQELVPVLRDIKPGDYIVVQRPERIIIAVKVPGIGTCSFNYANSFEQGYVTSVRETGLELCDFPPAINFIERARSFFRKHELPYDSIDRITVRR